MNTWQRVIGTNGLKKNDDNRSDFNVRIYQDLK